MITNIPIEKLNPHPDNPRKNLGDLTELAESIKANGIFQNLTVVPNADDTYTIIIGHRRKSAAEIAGLKELPCAIVEMSEKQQLSTMLLENMQRSDLTVYEQAQGFQLMLDLGESVENISKQTGFSKTTIYHRVHLLDLDQEEFKKSQEREVTINDYIKLEQIKNPEQKNEALKFVGTSQFDWKVQSILDAEKRKEQELKVYEYLQTVAVEITEDETKNYEYQDWVRKSDLELAKSDIENIKEEYPDETLYFCWSHYNCNLYTEQREDTEETDSEDSEQERKIQEIKDKMLSASKTMQTLRKNFIKNYTGKKEHLDFLLQKLIGCTLVKTENYFDIGNYGISRNIAKLMGIKVDEDRYPVLMNQTDYEELFKKDKIKLLLLILYVQLDEDGQSYYSYYGEYRKNEKLDLLYEVLETLGYILADEEKAFQDGTHPLFEENKKLRNTGN